MEMTKSTPNQRLGNLFDGFDAAYGSHKADPYEQKPEEKPLFDKFEIIPLEDWQKTAHNERAKRKLEGKPAPPPLIRRLDEAVRGLQAGDKRRAAQQAVLKIDTYEMLLPELELLEGIQECLNQLIDKRSDDLEDALRRQG